MGESLGERIHDSLPRVLVLVGLVVFVAFVVSVVGNQLDLSVLELAILMYVVALLIGIVLRFSGISILRPNDK